MGKFLLVGITTTLIEIPKVLIALESLVLIMLLLQHVYYQPCLYNDGLGPTMNNIRYLRYSQSFPIPHRTGALVASLWLTANSAWALAKGKTCRKLS
jgi:hypothetical protein